MVCEGLLETPTRNTLVCQRPHSEHWGSLQASHGSVPPRLSSTYTHTHTRCCTPPRAVHTPPEPPRTGSPRDPHPEPKAARDGYRPGFASPSRTGRRESSDAEAAPASRPWFYPVVEQHDVTYHRVKPLAGHRERRRAGSPAPELGAAAPQRRSGREHGSTNAGVAGRQQEALAQHQGRRPERASGSSWGHRTPPPAKMQPTLCGNTILGAGSCCSNCITPRLPPRTLTVPGNARACWLRGWAAGRRGCSTHCPHAPGAAGEPQLGPPALYVPATGWCDAFGVFHHS